MCKVKINAGYFKSLWNAGTHVNDMGVIFGVSNSTIRRMADRLKLVRRARFPKVKKQWEPVVNSKEIPDRNHCHFPIGDPKHKGFGYCCLPVFKRSYCIKCYGEVYK